MSIFYLSIKISLVTIKLIKTDQKFCIGSNANFYMVLSPLNKNINLINVLNHLFLILYNLNKNIQLSIISYFFYLIFYFFVAINKNIDLKIILIFYCYFFLLFSINFAVNLNIFIFLIFKNKNFIFIIGFCYFC